MLRLAVVSQVGPGRLGAAIDGEVPVLLLLLYPDILTRPDTLTVIWAIFSDRPTVKPKNGVRCGGVLLFKFYLFKF